MDEILDNLGPIALGIIYLLGWLFSKINKADEAEPDSLQDYDYEAAEEEYQRQLQSRNGTHPDTETGTQNSTPKNTTPIPNLSRQHQQVVNEEPRENSWDHPNDSYENEMEAQLKKIEATKREAARLQSQSQLTQEQILVNGGINNPKATRKKSSFRSVRSSLKSAKAARSAFIYSEVLGPPVSLRKDSGVPGLTS